MIMVTRLLCTLFLLLCLVHPSNAETGRIKIAVLDFQQNGEFETRDVGKMVAEWFTTSLVETGRFDVIERRLLQQIINEQKIGKSGIVEATGASRIGKILGVKTVVTGTVQSFDGSLEVNARVINAETGSIISAEKVRADSATRLTDLVGEISARIIAAFPLEGHVVKREGERVIIDLGKQAGVQPGMYFAVYDASPIKDPETGETLDMERIESGLIRIGKIREKTADGSIAREAGAGAISARQQVRMLGEPQDERDQGEPAAPEEAAALSASPLAEQAESVLHSHTGDIKALAFSSSGRLAASADNGSIILWDARRWEPLATLRGHSGTIKTVRFSRDERYLASGSGDETVILWDVKERSEARRFRTGHTVNAVAFSPDGRLLAAGCNSDDILLWDLRGAGERSFRGRDKVFALAFSPNGRLLAAAGNNRLLQLWDVARGELVRDFEGHRRDVRSVTFNREGNLLISGSNDNTIIYWDLSSGMKLKVLEGHEDSVRNLALSGDGTRLVSGDGHRQGGIIVWNAQSSDAVRRLDSREEFDALALSPDGCTLLLGCNRDLVVRRIP